MGIIYLLTNQQNEKRYIGKTVNTLDERWAGHCNSARRGDTSMYVTRAIAKWGIEAFYREVIEECSDDLLSERETFWITEFKTHVSMGGYNLTFGGEGLSGYKFSEQSKELIRIKAIGRKHSKESKEKMRLAKLGKSQKPDHVTMRIIANTGKVRTEEQKKRISDGNRGKKRSAETCANISRASKGRVTSEVTKNKFRKRVDQFTIDGNYMQTYNSITDAAEKVGVAKGTISDAVRNTKICKGFIWRLNDVELRKKINGDI